MGIRIGKPAATAARLPRRMIALAALLLVAAVVALPASEAVAHTLPKASAANMAKRAVAQVVRETNAASGRMNGCRRQTSHRFMCKGEARYRTGARRCTFNILVRYTSRNRRTIERTFSRYLCH